jgi:hypothetical protein
MKLVTRRKKIAVKSVKALNSRTSYFGLLADTFTFQIKKIKKHEVIILCYFFVCILC